MGYHRKVEIGNCVLYHGDATLVDFPPIHSLVTDPPYGMGFQSNHRKEKHKPIAGDGDARLLRWACELKVAHSAYVFCRWDNIPDIPKPKSLITWVKNNHGMGDLKHEHGRKTEVAAFYAGDAHFFPTGRPTDVIDARRTGNNHHGTEKPVHLMAQVIRWTDGVVTDPFMGSCSTGIACAMLGRPFIGVEFDEEHFETCVKRMRDAEQDLFTFSDSEAA